jgi:hypothetical protein
MGLLKEITRRGKDMTISSVVARLAEKYVNPFGKILNISFDSSNRSLSVTLSLKGETEHVTIKINKYEITEDAGRHYIVAREITASRPWIDAAAKVYLRNRPFKIPSHVAKALGFLAS